MKKIYSPKKIKRLYQSIENHLTVEEQEIIKEIMGDFNSLVCYAKKTKEYIKSKENEWLCNMNENHKLNNENKLLKEKIVKQENIINSYKQTFKG